jgi:hypothetical protein
LNYAARALYVVYEPSGSARGCEVAEHELDAGIATMSHESRVEHDIDRTPKLFDARSHAEGEGLPRLGSLPKPQANVPSIDCSSLYRCDSTSLKEGLGVPRAKRGEPRQLSNNGSVKVLKRHGRVDAQLAL